MAEVPDRPIVRVAALDHIVLGCADVETTMAWYVDVLGLEPLRVDQWRSGEVPFPSVRIDQGTIIDLKNEKCPVMGGAAVDDVYVDWNGLRVYFCCPGCDSKFVAEPDKYLPALGIDDLDAFKTKHAAKNERRAEANR